MKILSFERYYQKFFFISVDLGYSLVDVTYHLTFIMRFFFTLLGRIFFGPFLYQYLLIDIG